MKKSLTILFLVLLMMFFASCDRAVENIENNTNIETAVIAEGAGDGIMEDYPLVEDTGDASSEYKDFEYRTEYANLLDFDSLERNPYFAVAFIGYSSKKIMERRIEVIADIFRTVDKKDIEKIEHFDFDGDEWYLIVPRYKEYVDVKSLDGSKMYTSYGGEPFTVKCNVSDLYPNIEIMTDIHGGHSFSPQMGGNGRLIRTEDIWDITFYYDR